MSATKPEMRIDAIRQQRDELLELLKSAAAYIDHPALRPIRFSTSSGEFATRCRAAIAKARQ